MIVLDTNVVSELMKPSPSQRVLAWLGRQRPGSLATSTVTVAEVRYGLARLPGGRRATQLQQLADEVLTSFPGQVLAFDEESALAYGDIAAHREAAGHPIDALDAQIAAICRTSGAALATRNTKDFLATGVDLLDPWSG